MNTATSRPTIAPWIFQLFSAIDAADPDRFVAFLDQDARFCFGNAPPLQGRAAIREAVAGFFASIRRSVHTLERVIESHNVVAVQGTVTYTRLDQSKVTLPFADVLVIRGQLVTEYHIYIDLAPLLQR